MFEISHVLSEHVPMHAHRAKFKRIIKPMHPKHCQIFHLFSISESMKMSSNNSAQHKSDI